MSKNIPSSRLEKGFLARLVEDVLTADRHCSASDDPSNRRNLIRAMFAAIEGSLWICREHVRDVVGSLGELTPLIAMALQERTYAVGSRGELTEQTRHIALPAMTKLIVRQARRVAPDLSVDFSGEGWAMLLKAITIRNGVTHPKSIADLTVNDDAIATVRSGMFWTLLTTEKIMAATNAALVSHSDEVRRFVDALTRNEPNALMLYQNALAEEADDP